MKLIKLLVTCFLFLALFGCISPKSYVDPLSQKYTYEDVKRRSDPLKLKLTVEFQRHGEVYPKAESILRDSAERILRATSFIIPSEEGAVGDIKIIVNNTGDRGAAAAKGFGTGLTFGLIGNTVQDNYDLTMIITIKGKTITKSDIHNSIFTAIGNTSVPSGVQTSTVSVAFSKVLEQMILQGLKELQNTKELSSEDGINTMTNILFSWIKHRLTLVKYEY